MKQKRNTYHQKNGENHKESLKSDHSGIETRRMIIDGNGSVIFKPIKTVQNIPAGEYFPTCNRSDDGVLVPIQRTQMTNAESNIISSSGNSLMETTYSESEDTLSSIEESIKHNNDYNLLSDDLKDQFIPVHSYFPMENYNKGLSSAQENISRFLHSKNTYRKLNMDYRRGILLYGDPGTGKSQFIFQLSKELIHEWEAVVIRVEGVRALDNFHNHVMHPLSQSTNRLKVIIIEELADLCSSRNNISKLLSLLDSMVLRENVLFLITTNYPEQIPSNIVDRPARLDLLCPIYSKDFGVDFIDDWFEFCMNKPISKKEKQQSWYTEAKGELSPAYFKELFIYSQLHDTSVNEAWQVIKSRREEIKSDFDSKEKGIGFNI